eukprot:snap_masked-scaffold_24-processed-gene-1.12-mRNA-1 protein AED:1.00 eAED:1.00 QI:0/-1/0/0/-1/1/1/0/714
MRTRGRKENDNESEKNNQEEITKEWKKFSSNLSENKSTKEDILPDVPNVSKPSVEASSPKEGDVDGEETVSDMSEVDENNMDEHHSPFSFEKYTGYRKTAHAVEPPQIETPTLTKSPTRKKKYNRPARNKIYSQGKYYRYMRSIIPEQTAPVPTSQLAAEVVDQSKGTTINVSNLWISKEGSENEALDNVTEINQFESARFGSEFLLHCGKGVTDIQFYPFELQETYLAVATTEYKHAHHAFGDLRNKQNRRIIPNSGKDVEPDIYQNEEEDKSFSLLSIWKADIYDVSCKVILRLKHDAAVVSFAWMALNLVAVGFTSGVLAVYQFPDVSAVREPEVLNAEPLEIFSKQFQSMITKVKVSGKYLVVGLGDGSIAKFSTRKIALKEQVVCRRHQVTSDTLVFRELGIIDLQGRTGLIDFSACPSDPSFIAAVYMDECVRIYDLDTREQPQTLWLSSPQRLTSIIWTQGDYLVLTDENGVVWVVDIATGNSKNFSINVNGRLDSGFSASESNPYIRPTTFLTGTNMGKVLLWSGEECVNWEKTNEYNESGEPLLLEPGTSRDKLAGLGKNRAGRFFNFALFSTIAAPFDANVNNSSGKVEALPFEDVPGSTDKDDAINKYKNVSLLVSDAIIKVEDAEEKMQMNTDFGDFEPRQSKVRTYITDIRLKVTSLSWSRPLPVGSRNSLSQYICSGYNNGLVRLRKVNFPIESFNGGYP